MSRSIQSLASVLAPRRLLRLGGGLALFGNVAACLAPVTIPDQKVAFHVTSDPGKPLEGAGIFLDDREIAKTGPDGIASVTFHAARGNVVRLAVRCPEGYVSPVDKISVGLRGRVEDGKRPEYDLSCPPTVRSFVVAVRADNGGHLPVFYEGQEVSRTDESGAAHVLVSAAPGEQFALTLGTSEKKDEQLRPRNPTVTFLAGDHDEVLTMDQHFVTAGAHVPPPASPRKVARQAPNPDIPIRLVAH